MPFSCNLSNNFFLENIPLLDMFDIGDARGLWSPCRTDSSTARSAGFSGQDGSDDSLSGIHTTSSYTGSEEMVLSVLSIYHIVHVAGGKVLMKHTVSSSLLWVVIFQERWDWLYAHADVNGLLDVHNSAGEQELWGQEGHHSSTRTYRYKVYPYSWKLL